MHNISSPRNDDESVEQKIQAKCLKAPRVTPADLIANISSEYYFTAGQGASANGFSCHELSLDLLTICVLVLKNGYTIMGKSAVASSANFDAALGRSIARESAINELWPLMGYELRSKLHAQEAEDEIQ